MGTRKKMFLVALTIVVLTLVVTMVAFAAIKNMSGSVSVANWTRSHSSISYHWSVGAENKGTATEHVYLYVLVKKSGDSTWSFGGHQDVSVPGNTTLTQSGSDTLSISGSDGDTYQIGYVVTTTAGIDNSNFADRFDFDEDDDVDTDDIPVADSTRLDATNPRGYSALPYMPGGDFACNTFERFGVVTDTVSGIDTFAFQVNGLNYSVKTGGGAHALFYAAPYTIGAFDSSVDLDSAVTDVAGQSNTIDKSDFALNDDERASCKSFTDVAGHPDEIYIRYLGSAGVFAGYTDGSFKPNGTINRAELATMLVKAAGYGPSDLPTSAPAGCNFSDVHSGDWFAGWVWKACQKGFVAGYGDGTFRPGNPVLRAEAVTMLYNARNELGANTVIKNASGSLLGNPSYTDVPAWTYYANPVAYLYNAGIVDEMSGTQFRPGDYATRGEVAKWLYRSLAEYTAFP